MKSCYLDTNVLIYFVSKDSKMHKQTKALLKRILKQGFYMVISPLVLDEFLHSLDWMFRQKDVSKKERFDLLIKCLDRILKLPDLKIVNPPRELKTQKKVPKIMKEFNLRPRDAYHLLSMQSEEINFFATFDNDFEKVFRKKILRPPFKS